MEDAKEEIRARLAVEDVIGQYIELKRAGRNFKGHSLELIVGIDDRSLKLRSDSANGGRFEFALVCIERTRALR